jgi:hypothetical protein
VILVNEVEEFALTLRTVHALRKRLKELSSSTAGLNGSGGLSIVSCDLALDAGLSFPDFSPETADALRAAIPDFATVLNPLDYTTAMKGHEALLAVFKAIAAQTDINLVYTGIKLSGKKDAAEKDQQVIDRYAEYAGALRYDQALFLMTPPAIRLTAAQTQQLDDAGAYSIPVGSQGFRLMGRLGAYADRLKQRRIELTENERRALLKSL